jgi:hypothetical protein
VSRLRRALHAACVLAALLFAVLCWPAMKLPHPAGAVGDLVRAVFCLAMAATLISPKRTAAAPAAEEGSQS